MPGQKGADIQRPSKGMRLEITIEDLAYGGKGVARINGYVLFVARGLPGQRVLARIVKTRRQFGEAVIEEVLQPSPDEVRAPCPYFGVCGGCPLQHLRYEAQLRFKTRQIQDLLERIGGITGIQLSPALPAKTLFGYRNKTEFSFSDQRWVFTDEPPDAKRNFALGFHAPGRFDRVIDLDNCLLQSDRCNAVLRSVRTLTENSGLGPYSVKDHTGFWRFLLLREGKNTGDLMVHIITTTENTGEGKRSLETLSEALLEKHPYITTLVHSISDAKAQAAYGTVQTLYKGDGRIREKIGDTIFEISPYAFFQTNTMQAETLFETVRDAAGLSGKETLFDLYCGTGAIGLMLAGHVKQVVGIEVIPQAVADARRNALLNNIRNAVFLEADMKDALHPSSEILQSFGSPDVIVLDPPRGGTHPKTIKHLLDFRAPRLVYVSCNPGILARDLNILCDEMYDPVLIRPVDLFPHTQHIEAVALLERRRL